MIKYNDSYEIINIVIYDRSRCDYGKNCLITRDLTKQQHIESLKDTGVTTWYYNCEWLFPKLRKWNPNDSFIVKATVRREKRSTVTFEYIEGKKNF